MANAFWPDVSTAETAHTACKTAAYLAFVVGGLTAVAAILSIAGVEFLQRLGIDGWAVIDSVLFIGLGFGVLKHSRVAAVLLVLLYGGERLLSMFLAISAGAQPSTGIVMTVIFLAGFIGGLRGTFALARLHAEPKPVQF